MYNEDLTLNKPTGWYAIKPNQIHLPILSMFLASEFCQDTFDISKVSF